MSRRVALLMLLLLATLPLMAQHNGEKLVTSSGDTITYTYEPLSAPVGEKPAVESSDSTPIVADSVAERPGFWRRFINYFAEANVDKTYEKKFDVTFIGGPSYSSTTGFGIGVMAAGLYRTDRSDHLTPPSDVTLYGSAATSGFYTFGVKGNNIFKHDKHRIVYRVSFASMPTDYWGWGYEKCDTISAGKYYEKLYRVEATYLARLAKNLYLGPQVMFHYVNAKRFDDKELYIGDEKTSYSTTGVGVVAQYDSRDFAPNSYKGVYLHASFLYYPESLGSIDESCWKMQFTAAAYQRVWASGVLAMELFGEFNSENTPWPFMARLGGDSRMRGYYEGRYTDYDMMTLQVELRQRIWRRIGCVVWAGAGNVFPSMDKYDWSHTLYNYGVGLRWEFKNRVNVRFDFGFGRDSQGLVVNINEAF